MYIDTHSHINLLPLLDDVVSVVDILKTKNVVTITVGVNYATSQKAIELVNHHDVMVGATVGLHPNEVVEHAFDVDAFHALAQMPQVVAIGECGLDYYRDQSDDLKQMQKKVFRQHIDLALEIGKPLMLHIRPLINTMDAYVDGLDILEEYHRIHGDRLRGTAHFFVGDITIAQRFLAIGFYISFSGVVTFVDEYQQVLKQLPLNRILSETDSPFAAPVPHRGKMNRPEYVIDIVTKIAEIKGEPLEVVQKQIMANAVDLFGVAVDI